MPNWKFVFCVVAVSLACATGTQLLNTTCELTQFEVNAIDEILLNFEGSTTLSILVANLPVKTHFTILHYTELSRNELSFHQIGEGSRVTHEFGIEVFHSDNNTWMMVFSSDNPDFTGFYEIRIGDCYAKENLTALSFVKRYSGKEYILTVPQLAVASLKLYCPFVSSFFTLQVFYNKTEIKETNVFFDSPREDLFFYPIRSPDLPSSDYQCVGDNDQGFNNIDYYLVKNYSNISISTSLRVREDDVMQVNLTDMCLPFSSKFFTSSDSTGLATDPPLVSFALNQLTLTNYNLTVAELSHNGIYSCLITHSLFETQIQILDLYVKPLNVCAHSNGGCEHLCSTDIIADTFNCSCRPGYQLTPDLLGCEDVDECLSVSLHDCPIPSQVCKNEPAGSYSCECAAGYVLEGSGGECLDVDECVEQNGGCLHLCLNAPGSYFCECKFGYSLLPIDNMTCVDLTSTELDPPPSLLTPIILALVFGIIFLLSVLIIALLLIAVCKRSRAPTRLKYDMFSKRLSGDFKCHQQVSNPVFKLDQTSLFLKRISPRKNQASYGVLEDNDFQFEARNSKSDYRRPRSLEQAALSGEAIPDLDYNEDVVLPKILTTDTSPSLPKYEHSQSSKLSGTSSPSQRKYLPHSNMVPVLPSLGDGIQLRSVKNSSRHSGQDTSSQITNEIPLDQTFC